MKIHLIDGTYELFRAHFGAPPKKDMNGQEVGATLGLIRSLLMLLQTEGVTHVAVAFDHVIESFRNKMYAGYKTSEGVDPIILNQFEIAEKAVSALGVPVWSMVKLKRMMRLRLQQRDSKKKNPSSRSSSVRWTKI
jgi:5'-3' exonuclease